MPNKRYTAKDIAYFVRNYNKISPDKIAKKYGITLSNLRTLVGNFRKKGYKIAKASDKFKGAMEGFKFCVVCKRTEGEKPLSEFYNSQRHKDGKNGKCISCLTKEDIAKGRRTPRKNFEDGKINRSGKSDNKYQRKKKENETVLTDECPMPLGVYKDCKMVNVPAKHLLDMYEKEDCSYQIRTYVQNNIDVLQMQAKR